MNILQEHEDVFQNIESVAIAFSRGNASIKDAHIHSVYQKLLTHFDRCKRNLPDLPVALPPLSLELFKNVKDICETRIIGNPNELVGLKNVTPGIMALCFKRLIESVDFWTKKDGAKGYITFVSKAIP